MRPQTLLSLLIGGALAAAGLLQGLHWKRLAEAAGDADLQAELSRLQGELEILERENQSLRSLAQGGGELKVPQPLIDFVEDAAWLDFRSTPVVHQVATEELRDRVTASIESRFPPNSLDHRQQAWTLVGLLTPDDQFAPQLAATRSLGARSWFDDQSGDAWVTDRFDELSIPDQSALIRALVRILLHQHYPPPASYPGDEADRARNALHHGTAIAIENRFLARQALGIGFTGSQTNSGAKDLLASLPAFIRGLATFPSLRGTPRAESLIDQEEILSALHSPPQQTAWYYPHEEPFRPVPPELPETSGTNVLEESQGQLGFQLWLQTLDPELAPLASNWDGDRYRLSATDDSSLSLIWEIRLSSPEAATEVLPYALAMAGALAGSSEDPAPGEIQTSPEGRRLSVSQSDPQTIRFLNEATR